MFSPSAAIEATRPRFPSAKGGHVESYFIRANHPTEPKAFWLKATVLKPAFGSPVAETWVIVFDGPRRFTARETVPLESAHFEGSPPRIEISGARFHVDADGSATGTVRGANGSCTFDLSLVADRGPMGGVMGLIPPALMKEGPFPKFRLTTPFPVLYASGSLEAADMHFEVDRWAGMAGHNWGKAHSHEYAWGQCIFLDERRAPTWVVEAFTARIKLGPIISPKISSMVIRSPDEELRFDRLYDLWAQDSRVDDLSWSLRAKTAASEATLRLDAHIDRLVCLGYDNPDGNRSFCMNSKLAAATLELHHRGRTTTLSSAHGGALELLSGRRDPRMKEVT